jgi:dienelactone hydrolase
VTASAIEGAPVGSSTAVPTWFGPEDRPLFGWVHVPAEPNGQGVVLCPSIGLEGEASQMAYRSLARVLADSGCAVLRFDYHGTGDSTGFLTDPDRVVEWMADIAGSLGYLRTAGATRLHLVGARLGAALAARAASEDGCVESLTMWYPWTKGSQFLRYQRALRRLYAVSDDPESGDGATEIPGFVLDTAVTADLKALDTGRGDLALPKAVLVIDAADPATGEVGRPEFGPEWGVRRTGTGLDGLFGVELMSATVAEEDLEEVRAFIIGSGAAEGPVTVEPAVRVSARVEAPGAPPVVERPVTFGPAGLFGILTEPGGPTAHPRQSTRMRTSTGPVPEFAAALFLNAGSLHHVGPGRQWVELSRHWAAEGVRCLRMDIGGIGDSPVTGPPGLLSSYPQAALGDVNEGVHFLAPDDPGQVVLLGLCAGAYHALLAAPLTGVGGVAILNPLRLPSADQGPESMGDLIDGAPVDGRASTEGEEKRAAPAPKRRFLGTVRDKGVFRPVTKHLPDRFWWAARLGTGGRDPVDAFCRVVDSGTSLYVVLGPDEWPGIGRGRTHELKRVARSGSFAITYVPTLDHSFHVSSGRRDALAMLDQWILGTGPGGLSIPRGTKTIS